MEKNKRAVDKLGELLDSKRRKPITVPLATLTLIEEIVVNEMGLEDTKEQKIFGLIYKLVHNATSPHCRKNHPKWHKEFQELRKARLGF